MIRMCEDCEWEQPMDDDEDPFCPLCNGYMCLPETEDESKCPTPPNPINPITPDRVKIGRAHV